LRRESSIAPDWNATWLQPPHRPAETATTGQAAFHS
jgi:hypothetical protein